jgi:hypothetical protein
MVRDVARGMEEERVEAVLRSTKRDGQLSFADAFVEAAGTARSVNAAVDVFKRRVSRRRRTESGEDVGVTSPLAVVPPPPPGRSAADTRELLLALRKPPGAAGVRSGGDHVNPLLSVVKAAQSAARGPVRPTDGGVGGRPRTSSEAVCGGTAGTEAPGTVGSEGSCGSSDHLGGVATVPRWSETSVAPRRTSVDDTLGQVGDVSAGDFFAGRGSSSRSTSAESNGGLALDGSGALAGYGPSRRSTSADETWSHVGVVGAGASSSTLVLRRPSSRSTSLDDAWSDTSSGSEAQGGPVGPTRHSKTGSAPKRVRMRPPPPATAPPSEEIGCEETVGRGRGVAGADQSVGADAAAKLNLPRRPRVRPPPPSAM